VQPATPAASSGTASATAAIATGTGIRNAAGVPAQAGGAEFGFHGRGIVSAGGGDGNINAYGSAHAAVAGKIDSLPAGGEFIGVLVFVFVLLLVTDILGFTKVYSFTRPVKK
jgi:hypothetical protein